MYTHTHTRVYYYCTRIRLIRNETLPTLRQRYIIMSMSLRRILYRPWYRAKLRAIHTSPIGLGPRRLQNDGIEISPANDFV